MSSQAWRLHETMHDLGLVDTKLSSFNEEEVKRLIGVALLCTQASPLLRPHMSRVVAMIAGDIEVPEVTTRPGYLTELHLTDLSLSSNFASSDFSKASTSNYSQDSGVSSTSMAVFSGGSPSPSQPLVRSTIAEGR